MASPKEVAQWMIGQLATTEIFLQVDAVAAIKRTFGKSFVYMSDVRKLSIDRRVLYHFRKLTEDDVVWVTRRSGGFWSGAHWRKREPWHTPERTQYESE